MHFRIRTAALAIAIVAVGVVSSTNADHRRGYSRYSVGSYYGNLGYRGGYYNGAGPYSQFAPSYAPYAGYRGTVIYNFNQRRVPFGERYYNANSNGYRPAGMTYGVPNRTTQYHYSTQRRLNVGRFRGRYSQRYYGR